MSDPVQKVYYHGVDYSPITFEEFATHTKYSLFGVPRYRWTDKPVVILGTFSARKLSFTRKDFARTDKQMGDFAYLKPPCGGDAGPAISIGPDFDDAAWTKCKTLWQSYKTATAAPEDSIPRFFFLGTIMFDKKVFRSHYLALDSILFANSDSADPALPNPASILDVSSGGAAHKDDEQAISIKKIDPETLDPGI